MTGNLPARISPVSADSCGVDHATDPHHAPQHAVCVLSDRALRCGRDDLRTLRGSPSDWSLPRIALLRLAAAANRLREALLTGELSRARRDDRSHRVPRLVLWGIVAAWAWVLCVVPTAGAAQPSETCRVREVRSRHIAPVTALSYQAR